MKFKEGMKVTWQVGRAGQTKKVGKVLVVVPAEVDPNSLLITAANKAKIPLNVGPGFSKPRKVESYLVGVPSGVRKVSMKVYWPRVDILTKATKDEQFGTF